MNPSAVHLLDLPDEMIINIFNKLSNADVLNSILGANRQLDRLARDTTPVDDLDFDL
ncbi:unnamed protein product, partial [Rotaria magnacalcarata]